jgi:hypothetical protein
MRIHSFSKVVAIPFVAWFAYTFYISYNERDYALSYWMIPPFLIIAVIWVMSPQIDFWWNKRNPLTLDEPLRRWLQKYSPFYIALPDELKMHYENRLSTYLSGVEFYAMGKEKEAVPEDIKVLAANNLVTLTFGKKNFMLSNFDRVVFYKHPFPTPRFQHLHTVETEQQDGVILFSIEHLAASSINPTAYYNIGMHGYAEAFMKTYPALEWENLSEITWDSIASITGFSKTFVLSTLGFEQTDLVPVILTSYFSHPTVFKRKQPEAYSWISKTLSDSLL